MFFLECTIGPSWAVLMDIGGERSGTVVYGMMNMVGGQAIDCGIGALGHRGRRDENRAAQHAGNGNRPPRERDAAALRQQPMGRQSADGIAGDAGSQR